jgi:hypothetical protein
MPAWRSITALAGAVVVMAAVPTAAVAAPAEVDDAFAAPGANACSWTIGNHALEKQVVLDGDGRFTLTSFRNELTSPATEYVDPHTASAELRFKWDGATVTGATPGWTCRAGGAERIDAGGAPALEVDLTLARDGLEATKHYVVYPRAAQIREWVTYRNDDTVAHWLARPSFLEQRLMGDRTSDTDLYYMRGARTVAGSWKLERSPLSADYQRTFDSYDRFGCTPGVAEWNDIPTFNASGYLGMPEWHAGGGFVWPDAEHPGSDTETARAWTAPQDGVVDITGHAAKMNDLGNGVVVRILKNNEEIYAPRTIAGNDQTGVDVAVSNVIVAKGDVIRFAIANNGDYANDATRWNPIVAYGGGGPSFRASDGFSSTQGANGWRYQDRASADCTSNAWAETSSVYIPWFSLFDRAGKDGVFVGFDYYGRWAAPIGARGGGGTSLSLEIPNYDHELAPGESVESPKAFTGVYVNDLDDMTNRLLDWQYRYMWDYTRKPYFGAIRMLGYWYNGSQWTGSWDQVGTLQKVFGLSDHMRTVGGDTYHRDNGWWDTPGNWDGPDFKLSNDYLSQSGMRQLVYMPAYDANTDSRVYRDHPDWFQTASPCGYADRLLDLTKPAAEQWMGDLLVGKAAAWGDFQWRNDSCPVGPWEGARQLAQDQAFRRVQQRFLDERPRSAIQAVDSGGNEITYEFERMASAFSLTDFGGVPEQYDASRIFPVDKLSGIPDAWSPAACDASFNVLLAFNPDFTGDTGDPARLECMRALVDRYHYLLSRGVAGRWVHQFHPHGTDADRNWFERLSRDANRGLIVYKGEGSGDAVTVFPKGLVPGADYDVRFELAAGVALRTGADLMEHGIQLPSVRRGELIWVGLPDHPGSGVDTVAPSAPTDVVATVGTNMGYPGVELRWGAASDDHRLSYYVVERDGRRIGTVAKGRFFFDHTAGASPSATYAVRAVDGDGNISEPAMSSSGPDAETITSSDDAPSGDIVYGGGWSHRTGLPDAGAHTLSVSGGCPGCAQASADFSQQQGAGGWHYQDRRADGWHDITRYSASGYQGMPEWHDDDGGFVWPGAQHPGPANETGRAWIAPRDGTVDIASHVAKMNTQGDGVVVQITKNDATIWGPRTLAGTDTTGVDANVSGVDVHAGDVIRFEIANNGTWDFDATSWDPTISYGTARQPSSASYSFTGSQVTWFAKLGADLGKARVSIDGAPVATVDLYAPDDNNWSVPIFTRAFAQGGRHTITVTATGERNLRSSGSAITVDGFQALTSPVTATEDGDGAIQLGGDGWQATAQPSASGGRLVASDRAGASATFTFIGQRIAWVSETCRTCGSADVYVDGHFASRVDTFGYRGVETAQSVVFQRSFARPGRHTVRIVVTGTHNFDSLGSRVAVDALLVGGANASDGNDADLPILNEDAGAGLAGVGEAQLGLTSPFNPPVFPGPTG